MVGTDGSDPATRAVLWAAAEAVARDQPLTVVHGSGAKHARSWTADSPTTAVDEGRALLDEVTAKVSDRHPGLTVDTVLSRTDPGESLLEAARPQDTLVVGSRGHGGFGNLLLGSVGLHVCARSHGPVIVVREVAEPATGVVVAAVRDDGDRGALRFAARTAHARGATLRVISAWMFLEGAGSMAAIIDDVGAISRSEIEATKRTVDPIREEFPDVSITEDVVRSRSVAGSLVEASPSADLLVMGARRPARAIGAPLGRVTHAVLHHARCPVAVVPRG
ncbi:universal stress protein [Streptomyces sp. NPDC049040]|uniref:universal stress protein n=1 Tax=Streptomyces sp. NPDC049040 TaxID=3365593 RepID=UPI00371F6FB0